jgi:hypothetical protein
MRAASPGPDRAECGLAAKALCSAIRWPNRLALVDIGPLRRPQGPCRRRHSTISRARIPGEASRRAIANLGRRCRAVPGRDAGEPLRSGWRLSILVAGCRGRRGNQLLVRLTSAHSTRFEQSELWLDTRRSGGPAGEAHEAAHGPSRPQSSRISWPCTYSAAATPLPAGRTRQASRARLLDACCPLLVPRARAGIRRPGSPWCLIVRGTHVTSSQESERHRCCSPWPLCDQPTRSSLDCS